ncbi:hypothetical protein A2115_00985 [Candidatus Woesebacteria bacterium GWA1_41_8]|jgi:cytochrome c-type biogenesis protein|uniref:Cytochrome C biogenesis protein transmembrane domain-containing protein n=1 Tax=Candidatus Woesebacteria bacterium GWA1_41_8 TaxID=1802471 RepID=A0A1F7WHL8_9BACT|nr:MAG: hypothetical protein A2115_00985 [Candidatus Woesebacteria bacterium GWA1_41_8]
MFTISVPVAFVAGMISFFAPCVLPLVPAYVGFVVGVTAQEIKKTGSHHYRFKILISSLFYILGFSTVFVILGTTAGGLGVLFRQNLIFLQRVGGLIIILLGLEFSGFFNLGFLNVERRVKLPARFDRLGYTKPFFVGVVFAFAWTPCVGAILGSILALAAVNGTILYGAYLLFVYSLGISLPFLIVALTLAQAPQYLKPLSKYSGVIAKAAGIVLVILGTLLIFDLYKYVNSLFLKISF